MFLVFFYNRFCEFQFIVSHSVAVYKFNNSSLNFKLCKTFVAFYMDMNGFVFSRIEEKP